MQALVPRNGFLAVVRPPAPARLTNNQRVEAREYAARLRADLARSIAAMRAP